MQKYGLSQDTSCWNGIRAGLFKPVRSEDKEKKLPRNKNVSRKAADQTLRVETAGNVNA